MSESGSVVVDASRYAMPVGVEETRSHASALAYEWAYVDTCGQHARALARLGASRAAVVAVSASPIPDGWALAYLEHVRRATTHRLSVQDAFQVWQQDGTLPGLD